MRDDFDLVIVGGGIMGAWALHHAVQRYPHWRILLIDRYRIGDGATSHSAGVLLATGRTEHERTLAGESAELYRALRDRLGIRTTQAPVYWLADGSLIPEIQRTLVEGTVLPVDASGYNIGARLGAPLTVGATEKLLFGGTAESYEPALVARLLISLSLTNANVRCMEGLGAQKIDAVGNGTHLTLSDATTVRTRRTLVASGPWVSESPFECTAMDHGLRVKKVVALHIDGVPPTDAAALFLPQSDAYLMPLAARNQWLFSFRCDEWDVVPRKHALEINEHDVQVALRTLRHYLPDLVPLCRGGRVFCDSYSPSGDPVVSLEPGRNLVFAGAGSGKGFRLAPGIAREALDVLVTHWPDETASVEPIHSAFSMD